MVISTLENSSNPRVRFAPSPTGALHIGTMRTALFTWLFAQSGGGTFILRIEDTDQGRFVPGSAKQIAESLQWLGLNWHEGPEIGGPYGPYIQSERSALYDKYAWQLAESGHAYWCTCPPERLQKVREAQQKAGEATRYDRYCLSRQTEVAAERGAGIVAVLRLKIPDGKTSWQDMVSGDLTFDNAVIDDQILLKSDGFPTYHFAVVVDDHLMKISHVIRATEWISSTPKHLALYAAFAWKPPQFAHVPVVLAEDGKHKLSKRLGAPSILEYRDMGYLPEAVINAMALLGWSSETGEEVFIPQDLCGLFSLERVHNAPAVFDPKRLDHLNGLHIRRLNDVQLAEVLAPWLPNLDLKQRLRLAPLLRERIVKLSDATELVAPLIDDVVWNNAIAFPPKKVAAGIAKALLEESIKAVEAGGLDDPITLREQLAMLLDQKGTKARDGFRVLYIAMFGKPVGLPVFDVMAYVGKEITIQRLRTALTRV